MSGRGVREVARLPEPYYKDLSQFVDLGRNDEGDHIEIYAWFRNYQVSPLGFALGVQATFVLKLADEEVPRRLDVEIPYVEQDKCVELLLVSVPPAIDCTVMLVRLGFQDLHDDRHRHVYGETGTNALHGRLLWVRSAGMEASTPEGRSRGEGVDYNVGGVELI